MPRHALARGQDLEHVLQRKSSRFEEHQEMEDDVGGLGLQDGIVGPGTHKLINAQLGYGWSKGQATSKK